MPKTNRKTIDVTLTLLGAVAAVVLLVAGFLGLYAYNFATGQVHDQLAAQKVYFPPAGSPGLDPAEFPGLQQYAGQLVDNGPKAKAYADEFIAVHLEKVAGGQTYSEVSTAAMKDPTNTQLQQQKQTLFQGETLRGLLLGTGYAYWTFGMIAGYAAVAAFVGAALMAVLVLLGMRQIKRAR
ncbi:MAG: hypothetical protein ABIR37_03275 [Candidatus Saccharimonadales bacterium]